MDAAKKKSSSAQQSVEKEFQDLDALLNANPLDKGAIELQLLDVDGELARFMTIQEKYKDLLLAANDDATFDAEEAVSLAFRKRRNKAGELAKAKVGGTTAAATGTGAPPVNMDYHVNLPKRELPKFDGDVRNWRSFWASFKEVDDDAKIPPISKYNLLLQQMVEGSSAHKLVSSFPASDTSYQIAKAELEERFGREATLIKVYVRDLIDLMDAARNKKKTDFVDVVTSLQSQILNLEQLGVTKDKFGLLLYPMIESSLPVDVFGRYLASPGCKEDLEDVMTFIKKEVRRMEETARAQATTSSSDRKEEKAKKWEKSTKESTVPTAAAFVNANVKEGCGFCGYNHATTACRKAQRMSHEERKSALKTTGTCFLCLGGKHFARKCTAKVTCAACQGPHHVLMCVGQQPQQRIQHLNANMVPQQQHMPAGLEHQYCSRIMMPLASDRHSVPTQAQDMQNWTYGPGPSVPSFMTGQQRGRQQSTVKKTMTNFVTRPEVVLQTLLVKVYSPSGFWRVARCMIDSGSQSSYVKQSLAEELQYPNEGKGKGIHQMFGGVMSKEQTHPVTTIAVSGLQHPYNEQHCFLVSVVDKITGEISAPPSGLWISECYAQGIPLSGVDSMDEIEVFIGNDISPYLRVGMRSVLLPSNLVATETSIGWFLEGKIRGSEKRDSSKAMLCVNMLLTEKEVESFWALETIGINDARENRTRQELEEAALDHFNSTVKRNPDGRYKVHLPFIDGHPSLPENRQHVEGRLRKVTQDLLRDGYIEKYHDIFMQWEKDGIIERVPAGEKTTGIVHYLAHRPVHKESSTTPVRPVFNASAKTKNSPSLNDCLEKGPNLLEMIPSLLSSFRLDEIGVVADVQGAFLQMEVTEEHRDSLRFLWYDDVDNRIIVEYRHCRVVFGVNCSPYLLAAVIQHLLKENERSYPETVQLLKKRIYVDNLVASLPTLQDVEKFRRESVEIFASAQMNLRGWEIGPSSEDKCVSVLGMLWYTKNDTLAYDIKKIKQRASGETLTRRTVLALANSLFDPLGLLSPVVIGIKTIFKRICADEQKFGWDTELPEEYVKQVDQWALQLPCLEELRIPRVIPKGDRKGWSFHVMADASKESYACCVFLRCEGNPVRVQLVQARARVTPIKGISIPRAELVACFIAARLYDSVTKDLELEDLPVTFWSDSTCALTWIKRTDAVWAAFTNRRVEEIRKLTNVEDWRHIPGELNPADLPSRGTTAEKFMTLRWWEGPDWLYGPSSSFPQQTYEANEEEVAKEKRKTVVSNLAVKVDAQNPFLHLESLGSWCKVVRVVAYLDRSLRRMRGEEIGNKQLSLMDLRRGEQWLLRGIQRYFHNNLPQNLKLKKDEDGILRVVTKIVMGNFDHNFRYPILLPAFDPLVKLLIMQSCVLECHADVQYLMPILRSKFWILKSRRTIKSAIKDCTVCRIHTAQKCQVEEAPLPMDRIKTTRCFSVTGVDLAGPLFLKDGTKAWVVLFTCAVYRAVHMELVTSLSSDAFLVALRKFIVRRGRPNTIYSDNGTNFTGCSNLFKKVNWERVQEYATVTHIDWIFNPPSAAWWGGWWERLVGMTKQLLRRILGDKTVDYFELEVLVLEVESVLNERPLTYVSDTDSELVPLTPSMFLRDLPVGWIPEADVTEATLRENRRHVQRLREELRSRFRKEYLSQLVHRGKQRKSVQLQVGDVVLIEEVNKKRIEWPMGMVVAVIPGRDGICRTALVRTKTSEMVRPFQRLFPVEMNREEIPAATLEESSTPVKPATQEAKKVVPEQDIVTRAGRIVKKVNRFKP